MNIYTFTELRSNLKQIMDESADQHEPALIRRPKKEAMVLLSLREYQSLQETAYLLSNKANSEHLRASLQSVEEGVLIKQKVVEPC